MTDKRRSTRRQFLKGRAAADALTDAVDQAIGQENEQSGRGYLLQVGRRAMACQFEVFLRASRSPAEMERAVEALDLIDRLEDQLSVYRHRSEVSQLNAIAAMRPVPVEAGLFELLQYASRLSHDTQGAFDLTTGPLIKVWGFFRRQGRIPDPSEIEDAMQKVGYHHVELNTDQQTVFFRQEQLELNFGAIGKGYALDRCRDLLSTAGVADFMIHGGNSSVVARGNRTDDPTATGWTVGLRHPLLPEKRFAEIRLVNQAVGTSGTGNQFFFHQGKRYGHIIDPRSGRPAEGVLSVTVVAPDAATADALGTAFFVMGRESIEKYCAEHPDLGVLVTRPGKRAGELEIDTWGLDNECWSRVDTRS